MTNNARKTTSKIGRVLLASVITAAVVLFVPICFIPSGDAFAAPDSNGNGHPADALTISVGYAGYPYETRKTYTPSSLMGIGGEVRQIYSWIDRMPAPCINPARGVTLEALLTDAGIDSASAERIHFTCNDEHETEELTAPYLFDVTKYYYPNLFSYWDYNAQEAGLGAGSDRERVETIIAVEDVWQRLTDAEDERVGFGDMDGERRFRLVFGMTDTEKQTAYNSAMWITSIEVMLAGAPPEEESNEDDADDNGQQDEKVGSEQGDKPAPAGAEDNRGMDQGKDSKDNSDANREKNGESSNDDKGKGGKDNDETDKDKKNNKKGSEAANNDKNSANASSDEANGGQNHAQEDEVQSAGATPGAFENGVMIAALAGGSGEMTIIGEKTLKELTLDDMSGVDGARNSGAYQPWRTHDISDDAVWLKAAGLRGDLEGPVGIGLGGLAGIGAGLYLLGIKRGIF